MIGAVAAIGVIWGGIASFKTNPPSVAPPVAEVVKDSAPAAPATALPSPSASAPASAASASPPHAPSPARATKAKPRAAEIEVATSAGVHEVIPDVPDRARRSIRGHVRVSVRVIVDPDGSVFAALTEQRGPSRYFERLAIDAAKKWAFPPTEESGQRFMLVKFDFSREGATAQAVALK